MRLGQRHTGLIPLYLKFCVRDSFDHTERHSMNFVIIFTRQVHSHFMMSLFGHAIYIWTEHIRGPVYVHSVNFVS